MLKMKARTAHISHKDVNLSINIQTPWDAQLLKTYPQLLYVYFKHMEEEHKDELMDWYTRGDLQLNAITSIGGMTDVSKKLLEETKDIKAFDDEVIKTFISNHLQTEGLFAESYDDLNPEYDRASTYLASHYIDLIVLTVRIKLFVPMLTTYMYVGKQYYSIPEMQALRILPEYILESRGILDLRRYIEYYVDGGTYPRTLLHKYSLSTNELPEYLLGTIVFRRLISALVISDTKASSAVGYIYHIITSKMSEPQGGLKDKTVHGPAQAGESTTGAPSKYRSQPKYGVATNVLLTVAGEREYFRKYLTESQRVEFDANVDVFVKHTQHVNEGMSILAAIVFPEIPYMSLLSLHSNAFKEVMYAASLRIREHIPYIGALLMMSLVPVSVAPGQDPYARTLAVRSRLTDDDKAEIKELCALTETAGSRETLLLAELINELSGKLLYVMVAPPPRDREMLFTPEMEKWVDEENYLINTPEIKRLVLKALKLKGERKWKTK